MKKRIKELEFWPPELTVWKEAHGTPAPTREQVTIKEVQMVVNGQIKIICEFGGREADYFLTEKNQKTVEKVVKILKDNIGNPLLSVEKVEIPEN